MATVQSKRVLPGTMALNQSHHRLFVGFQELPALFVFDTYTGKPIASITISSNVNDTFYDAVNKLIFASCVVDIHMSSGRRTLILIYC